RRLVPLTSVTESSLWPTPNSSKAGNDVTLTASGDGRQKPNKLGWAVAMWPTPDASIANDGEPLDKWQARREREKAKHRNGNGFGMPLSIAVRLWPTPTAVTATGGASLNKWGGSGYRRGARVAPAQLHWALE